MVFARRIRLDPRPDEEGIKTAVGGEPLPALRRLDPRPDEEGIKTAVGGEPLPALRVWTHALMKKGLRPFRPGRGNGRPTSGPTP